MKAIVYALVAGAAINPAHGNPEFLDYSCLTWLSQAMHPDLFTAEADMAFSIMFESAMVGIENADRGDFIAVMQDACIEDYALSLRDIVTIAREEFASKVRD